MKFIIFFAITLCTTSLLAQTTSQTQISSSKNKLSSPFTLEFLIAGEQTRDIVNKDLNGTFTKMDSSLLQSLNKDHELRYFFSTRFITNENERDEFDFWFAEFMYRRKNLLTQSNHGVDLTFEFKNLYYIDSEIREMYGYNGSTIPQIIFKKNFGRAHSVNLKLRRHFNHTNNNSSYTVNNEDRVYLNFSSMLSRRYLALAQFKYQHKFRKGEGLDYRFMDLAQFNYDPMAQTVIPDFSKVPTAKKEQEIVTFHPGIMYFISRQTALEVYYETKLSNTYDKRDLETIMNDEALFGAALYLTAF